MRDTEDDGNRRIEDVSVDDYRNITDGYLRRTRFKTLFLASLAVLCFLLVLFIIRLGAADLTYADILRTLIYRDDPVNVWYVFEWRIPRILAAILCGFALGLAGVVMQGILRNPMASPFTLGTSNAAAFGAAFGMMFLNGGVISSLTIDNPYIVTISAFLFSMVSTAIILLMIRVINASPESIILAGIAVSAIFASGLAFLQYFADEATLMSIVFWQFGSLSKMTSDGIRILSVVLTACFVYFVYKRWDYNAMESGDEMAKGLGVNTERTRVVGLILSALMTSIAVSYMGIIGFVGLVAPHIVKRIIGNDFRYVLVGSMLMGAVVMLLAELFASHAFPHLFGTSLPIGIVTSLIGGPVFLAILIGRRSVAS